jgi:hypothetical protein
LMAAAPECREGERLSSIQGLESLAASRPTLDGFADHLHARRIEGVRYSRYRE